MMMTTMRGPRLLTSLLAVGLIVIALGACTTPRPAIDYDPGVNFAEYRTYEWMPDDALETAEFGDPRLSPLARTRARAAIDQALLAKGYVRAAPPDFVVALTLGLHDRQFVDPWGPYPDPLLWRRDWRAWPYGPFGYDPFFARPIVRTVTEGTLAVNMFDADTKRPIWHGHVTRVVGRNDIRPVDIQRMVDALLAEFPPSPTIPPNTVGVAGILPPLP